MGWDDQYLVTGGTGGPADLTPPPRAYSDHALSSNGPGDGSMTWNYHHCTDTGLGEAVTDRCTFHREADGLTSLMGADATSFDVWPLESGKLTSQSCTAPDTETARTRHATSTRRLFAAITSMAANLLLGRCAPRATQRHDGGSRPRPRVHGCAASLR